MSYQERSTGSPVDRAVSFGDRRQQTIPVTSRRHSRHVHRSVDVVIEAATTGTGRSWRRRCSRSARRVTRTRPTSTNRRQATRQRRVRQRDSPRRAVAVGRAPRWLYGARPFRSPAAVSARGPRGKRRARDAYASVAFVVLASLGLWTALLTSDFSLRFVASYTSANLPRLQVLGVLGGQPG